MAKLRTVTVRELIEMLEDEQPDMKVLFSTDYGDIIHTRQALPIAGDFELMQVRKSAYSNSGYALREDEEDEVEDGEGGERFLIIG